MSVVRVTDLAYLRVRLPDLDAAERFMLDFGLLRVQRTPDALYMRASGPAHHVHIVERGEPKFLSLAFVAASEADLHKLSALPGASAVEPIAEPGGGQRVRLTDPDGNGVEVVHGMATLPAIEYPRHPLNDAQQGLRRAGTPSRHEKGPSKALRIGHGVLMSQNPPPVIAWYRQTLGLLCSDEVRAPDGEVVLSFHRLDRGDEYVDHHVFMVQAGPKRGLNHVSYEVQDVDDLMLGHEHLHRQGYDSVWGVGRHVYGAQIFDYWLDPWGFMYEHWTDTDRMNSSFRGTTEGTIESANGPWGADVPARFFNQAHD